MGREKIVRHAVIVLFLILIAAFNAFPQDKAKNVVYLKSGRIIAGRIIEIVPDKYVTILSVDNVTFTIDFSEISYIGNERIDYYSETTDTALFALGIKYGLFAGFAFPTEELGSTHNLSSGYAKAGFIAGGEVDFPVFPSLYIDASVAVSDNTVDEESVRQNGIPGAVTIHIEHWNTYWFTPGVRWESNREHFSIYVTLNYGWARVQSPAIALSDNYSNVTSSSYSDTEKVYNFSIGGTVFDYFTAGIRYCYTKPMLPMTVMSNPEILTPSTGKPMLPHQYYYQPVTIYSLVVGVRF